MRVFVYLFVWMILSHVYTFQPMCQIVINCCVLIWIRQQNEFFRNILETESTKLKNKMHPIHKSVCVRARAAHAYVWRVYLIDRSAKQGKKLHHDECVCVNSTYIKANKSPLLYTTIWNGSMGSICIHSKQQQTQR